MSKFPDIGDSINALNPGITDPKRCNNGGVPEILKPNCRQFSETQSIDTSLLDPVVVKSDYIRFVLDRKGILHSNSKISLQFNSTTGDPATDKAFLPFTTGAKSFIKKCVLRAGTTILDSTDSFNLFSAYKNTFANNEQVLRRDRIKSGVVGAYKEQILPEIDASGVLDGTEQQSEMSYDLGREFELKLTAGSGTSTRANETVPVTVSGSQDLFKKSDFVIDLHDMFNSLRTTQLPLYMIEQPVIIELFLENVNTNRICQPNEQVTMPVFELDQTSPSLIADYIYYDAETMNDFRDSNPMLTLPFMEHKLITTTANFGTTPNYIRNLGGASKSVSVVYIAHTDLTDDLSESLYNRYLSDIPGVTGDSLEFNLKINDKFLYPVSISNPSEQYVQTIQAEGIPMNISARDYVNNLGVDYTDKVLIEEYDQQETVTGFKRFMAIRNITGERINNRGIELHMNVKGADDFDLQQLVWIQINKTLALENGRFSEIYN